MSTTTKTLKSPKKLFMSLELRRLAQYGQLDQMIAQLGDIICPSNLVAKAHDVSVFRYIKDGRQYVCKVAPKNLRFFKSFGRDHRSAKDFKKFINKLEPYFVPVDQILYEDDNVFVYTQQKCHLIRSHRINRRVVIDVLRLIQFMLINNLMLTDLAPHNLGLLHHHVVVFDYHGLHRWTKGGQIRRPDWWRRLARNITRFVCALHGAHKRAEYSALMQSCTLSTVVKIEHDTNLPKELGQIIRYLYTKQNQATEEQLCQLLEQCINAIKKWRTNRPKSA